MSTLSSVTLGANRTGYNYLRVFALEQRQDGNKCLTRNGLISKHVIEDVCIIYLVIQSLTTKMLQISVRSSSFLKFLTLGSGN